MHSNIQDLALASGGQGCTAVVGQWLFVGIGAGAAGDGPGLMVGSKTICKFDPSGFGIEVVRRRIRRGRHVETGGGGGGGGGGVGAGGEQEESIQSKTWMKTE